MKIRPELKIGESLATAKSAALGAEPRLLRQEEGPVRGNPALGTYCLSSHDVDGDGQRDVGVFEWKKGDAARVELECFSPSGSVKMSSGLVPSAGLATAKIAMIARSAVFERGRKASVAQPMPSPGRAVELLQRYVGDYEGPDREWKVRIDRGNSVDEDALELVLSGHVTPGEDGWADYVILPIDALNRGPTNYPFPDARDGSGAMQRDTGLTAGDSAVSVFEVVQPRQHGERLTFHSDGRLEVGRYDGSGFTLRRRN